MESPKGLFLFK